MRRSHMVPNAPDWYYPWYSPEASSGAWPPVAHPPELLATSPAVNVYRCPLSAEAVSSSEGTWYSEYGDHREYGDAPNRGKAAAAAAAQWQLQQQWQPVASAKAAAAAAAATAASAAKPPAVKAAAAAKKNNKQNKATTAAQPAAAATAMGAPAGKPPASTLGGCPPEEPAAQPAAAAQPAQRTTQPLLPLRTTADRFPGPWPGEDEWAFANRSFRFDRLYDPHIMQQFLREQLELLVVPR